MAETTKTKELTTNELFPIAESMDGIEARLPQIGIIHQGQLFAMPDGRKIPGVSGTILDINKVNAYWIESFSDSGGGTPPDCASMNGIIPSPMSESPQSTSCAICPKNKFGSAGRAKACKNMKRVHLLVPGELLPYRITIPPSSLRVVDMYVSLLTSRGIPYQLVTTDITLKEKSNKEGIAYSELVMKEAPGSTKEIEVNDVTAFITSLSMDDATRVKKLRDRWLEIMRGQPVDESEYIT